MSDGPGSVEGSNQYTLICDRKLRWRLSVLSLQVSQHLHLQSLGKGQVCHGRDFELDNGLKSLNDGIFLEVYIDVFLDIRCLVVIVYLNAFCCCATRS
jgi:hypothetical protein